MPLERGQKLEHTFVIAPGLVGQYPADVVGEVVIAHWNRILVAECDEGHRGRSPHSQAGNGHELGACRLQRELGQSVKAVSVLSTVANHFGSFAFDAETVEPPIRHIRQMLGVDGQQQIGRTGRPFTQASGYPLVRNDGFAARDSLGQHNGKTHLPNVAHFGNSQTGMVVMKSSNDGMVSGEMRIILVFAANFGKTLK
jgi:hypothetical protein